jgi:hypothetical protein
MKLERSNVEFAIWRKKVDKSLFEHNGTTVPEWACRMWSLQDVFGVVTSRKDPRSKAIVIYKGEQFAAWVTAAPHGRKSPAYRLWYDPILSLALKRATSLRLLLAITQNSSRRPSRTLTQAPTNVCMSVHRVN